MMPEMDGYEACIKLKSDPRTSDIPIIFLTAKTQDEDEQKGFELGAVDYITKPISPPTVLARVKTHLQLKQVRDVLKEKNAALLASRQALAAELAQAADYVVSLIPAPLSEGAVTTAWRFFPCAQLGGDSFGYHWIDEDNFAMYLLDVCGHGVGSALLIRFGLQRHPLPDAPEHGLPDSPTGADGAQRCLSHGRDTTISFSPSGMAFSTAGPVSSALPAAAIRRPSSFRKKEP